MTKKLIIISTTIIFIQFDYFGQQLQDSVFHVFRTKIQSTDFPPFQAGKLKFNRTKYTVNTNDKKDTLIIERIKVSENGYSDPSNDKEIRSVAFRDIDFKMTAIENGEDFFFFEIYTNNKQNLVNYQLIRADKVNSAVNNKIGIGRFSKSTVSERGMQELVELFGKLYN